ncbi:hypothetical protein D3C72_2061260 [compost metagenome]
MPTDNHIQVARRQATCHLYVPRRVGAMITIVVVAHVGGGDNHVRLFIFAQLIHHLLGFLRRNTEFDIGKVFRVADFCSVIGGQADHRNLHPLLFKQGIRLEQALLGAFLINVGGQ